MNGISRGGWFILAMVQGTGLRCALEREALCGVSECGVRVNNGWSGSFCVNGQSRFGQSRFAWSESFCVRVNGQSRFA